MEIKSECFVSEMIDHDDGEGSGDERWGDSDFEEEEALSLSDLPTFNDSEYPSRVESPKTGNESQEEFDFCLWSKDHQSLHETELCAADDVFFQGQILPMDSFAIKRNRNQNERISSMVEEHIFTTSSESSSRSSSLNSTSSTSPKAAAIDNDNDNEHPKTRLLNQFQFSHPSPKPHIRNPSSTPKNCYFSSNPNTKSGSWPLFQVGLVTTPEIVIQDHKVRNNGKRSNNNNNSKNPIKDKEKKKEQSLFDKNRALFNSCKCSAVNSASIVMKEDHHHNPNPNPNANANAEGKEKRKQKQRRAGKQSITRHNRTFEWLKQLSLETATDRL